MLHLLVYKLWRSTCSELHFFVNQKDEKLNSSNLDAEILIYNQNEAPKQNITFICKKLGSKDCRSSKRSYHRAQTGALDSRMMGMWEWWAIMILSNCLIIDDAISFFNYSSVWASLQPEKLKPCTNKKLRTDK